MSRRLTVVLYDRVIGQVEQSNQGRHSFSCFEDYASSSSATPLSISMPVAAGTYPQKFIEPWMMGLLPDAAAVRDRWGASFDVSANNPFALLEHMGLDCAGAVQFVSGEVSDALDRPRSRTELTDPDIAARIRALRADDSAWTVPGDRWSLAGAQGKFALARDQGGAWYEPKGGEPSTHILKPGVATYRHQALNEHVCLEAARALGLQAVRSEFSHFEDQSALVVARYDRRRVTTDRRVLRIHQEDLCQALAIYPRNKNESSGGPTAVRIATLLRRSASTPDRDVRRFVEAVAFNYLIGAPDAHAKNYSVLLAGTDVELAPLYDVASAFPYEPIRADHELDEAAMAIGGHRQFGSVEGAHWDRFAAGCGVERGFVRHRVAELADALPGALERALDPFRSTHDDLRSRLLAGVSAHCATTLTGLTTASEKPSGRPVTWMPGLPDRL